ncbi:MAG: ROK family protein [Verrucomicrobiales bacterium]|nr:ROK family protein [Verrucomicrobiales bacterium]
MNSVITHYQFILRIPGKALSRTALLYDPALNGSGGIDTKNLKRGYPESCLKLPAAWLEDYEQKAGVCSGPVVVQTWRNLIQNPRCPAWSRETGLCQSATEQAEHSRRPYYGISILNTGKLRAEKLWLSESVPQDVVCFGTGIPVLLERRVLTLEEMITEVADVAHLWALRVSTSRPSDPNEVLRYEELQRKFTAVRHAPAAEASEVLMEQVRSHAATGEPLTREHNYLHNLVGVLPDGGAVLAVAHGSLESLGEIAREAGAVAAIVVDNGGSCQVALRRAPGQELRPLVESYYHRCPSIAVAVYEINAAGSYPLMGVASVDAAAQGTRSIAHLRQGIERVELSFETDVGTVSRSLSLPKLNADGATAVALEIGNFAVIHGASSVAVTAPEGFVRHVCAEFQSRYCVTPRSEDPTRKRGLWLSDYLAGIYDTPFKIAAAKPTTDPVAACSLSGLVQQGAAPLKWSIGLDIGARNIKSAILRSGEEVIATSRVLTALDPESFSSPVLCEQINRAVHEACNVAGIDLQDLGALGVCWPGAVRNRKAAPSKTLLDMKDVLSCEGEVPVLNLKLYNEIRDLAPFLKRILGLAPHLPMGVYNDGEVEVVFEACRSARRSILLCKLGTTVAGGFIDARGDSSYLTELGRCVIRTDGQAPRHPSSRIQGVASRLIGSMALAACFNQRMKAAGLRDRVSEQDAGRELVQILAAGGQAAAAAEMVIDEMGQNLANLIAEAIHHLGMVQHVLLRGGPAGDHAVGKRLRTSALAHLPNDIAGKVGADCLDQHSGANAAAWLAARQIATLPE